MVPPKFTPKKGASLAKVRECFLLTQSLALSPSGFALRYPFLLTAKSRPGLLRIKLRPGASGTHSTGDGVPGSQLQAFALARLSEPFFPAYYFPSSAISQLFNWIYHIIHKMPCQRTFGKNNKLSFHKT